MRKHTSHRGVNTGKSAALHNTVMVYQWAQWAGPSQDMAVYLGQTLQLYRQLVQSDVAAAQAADAVDPSLGILALPSTVAQEEAAAQRGRAYLRANSQKAEAQQHRTAKARHAGWTWAKKNQLLRQAAAQEATPATDLQDPSPSASHEASSPVASSPADPSAAAPANPSPQAGPSHEPSSQAAQNEPPTAPAPQNEPPTAPAPQNEPPTAPAIPPASRFHSLYATQLLTRNLELLQEMPPGPEREAFRQAILQRCHRMRALLLQAQSQDSPSTASSSTAPHP